MGIRCPRRDPWPENATFDASGAFTPGLIYCGGDLKSGPNDMLIGRVPPDYDLAWNGGTCRSDVKGEHRTVAAREMASTDAAQGRFRHRNCRGALKGSLSYAVKRWCGAADRSGTVYLREFASTA